MLFSVNYFPPLISGFLLTAGFPNPDLGYAAFFALVPFLVALDPMDAKQAFKSGLVMGLCHYTTLIYWIIPTLSTYGGLHFLLSASALILLGLYLSLFPAVFAFAMKKLDPPQAFSPILGSLIWVGLEFARTHLFTGFPWGVMGYTQYDNLILVQTADLAGVLGLSFLILLGNYLLAGLWIRFSKAKTLSRNRKRQLLVCLAYIPAIFALAFSYGNARIETIDQRIDKAPRTGIAIVQGNIKQDLKWSPAFKQATVEKYGTLSLKALESRPDLIVWPETALPFYYGHDTLMSNRTDAFVRKAKTHFLMGSPALEIQDQKTAFYNRAYMLNPLSLVVGHYDKTHLVPFGEYVPFGRYLSFLGKLTAQAGDFSPGTTGPVPLKFKGRDKEERTMGVLICFEILFPSISRQFVLNGAHVLATLTNDAWFGRTSAPGQHFAIAVLRAVENRRTMVRAANSGISGFIDPGGRIMDKTPLFQDRVIARQVPVLEEISFYTRYPEALPLAALVAILASLMVKVLKKVFRRTEK